MPSYLLPKPFKLWERDKSWKPTNTFLDALLVHLPKILVLYAFGFFYFGIDSHWSFFTNISQLNNQIIIIIIR